MALSDHIVVMGVSGTGKTTIGNLLADRLGRVFAEGDQFHSRANIAKMSGGIPLTDSDREPWLRAISAWMTQQYDAGRSTVVACSALRRSYRKVLTAARGSVAFVHLTGDAPLLARRIEGRTGHFMPEALLDSQFATLEPLRDGEGDQRVTVDVSGTPAETLRVVLAALGAEPGS